MKAWTIGKFDIVPNNEPVMDPRGLLLMYEEPKASETYVVGVDPAGGIAHWNRYLRNQDDLRVDNAAIEVLRVGNPDVQVAEYAAPIDAIDLAPVVNVLGRLYCGKSDDKMAQVIGELQGSGILVVRELLDRFNYTNLWRWAYLNLAGVQKTKTYWWNASREGNRLLFSKCLHHISHKRLKIYSPWLVEEMADCTMDMDLAKIKAMYGRKDDRIRAVFMAIWAAHEWTEEDQLEELSAEGTGEPDWQKTDISVDGMVEAWNERFSQLLGEE